MKIVKQSSAESAAKLLAIWTMVAGKNEELSETGTQCIFWLGKVLQSLIHKKNFKSLNMLSLGRCTTTKALLNDRAKEVQLGDPTSVSLVPKPVPFSVASDESWLGPGNEATLQLYQCIFVILVT